MDELLHLRLLRLLIDVGIKYHGLKDIPAKYRKINHGSGQDGRVEDPGFISSRGHIKLTTVQGNYSAEEIFYN